MSPRRTASAIEPASVRQHGPGHDDESAEDDRGHELHAGGHPEAADDPAAERGDDVERAPAQGGAEAGQQSEGHPRSLAAGTVAIGPSVAPVGTARGGARLDPCYHCDRSGALGRPSIPWGCSSAGRAPRSHRGGQGFESPHLHHPSLQPGDRLGRSRRRVRERAVQLGRVVAQPAPPDLVIRAGARRPRPRTAARGRTPADGPARG